MTNEMVDQPNRGIKIISIYPEIQAMVRPLYYFRYHGL